MKLTLALINLHMKYEIITKLSAEAKPDNKTFTSHTTVDIGKMYNINESC